MGGLTGMKQICLEANRSESTVLKLYYTAGFPMAKIGGLWESSTEAIDKWRLERIAEDVEFRRNGGKKNMPVKQKKW